MKKKDVIPKGRKSVLSLAGIIFSVLFIWIFIFSIWYANNINSREAFVNKTTEILQSETVRTAISNEIIDIVKKKRPLIGTVTAPVLSNIITGVLDTDLFSAVYKRMAGELHLQLTTKNPRPLIIDVKQTKDVIRPLVASGDGTLLNDFPDQIVIIGKNQIPSLYLFGTYLGILGPVMLILALIILGSIWIKTANKRSYFIKLFLVIAASGVLIYFLIPTIGTFLISKFSSVNLATIVGEIYASFTAPLVRVSMISVGVGLFGAVCSKWLNREIFRIPVRRKRSRK